MVITPTLFDQFDFAKLVVRKGCGVDAGPLIKVKADALAGYIKRCLEDNSMKQSAKTIGETMCRQNGVEAAVRECNRFLNEEVKTGNLAKSKEALMKYRMALEKKSKYCFAWIACCK